MNDLQEMVIYRAIRQTEKWLERNEEASKETARELNRLTNEGQEIKRQIEQLYEGIDLRKIEMLQKELEKESSF